MVQSRQPHVFLGLHRDGGELTGPGATSRSETETLSSPGSRLNNRSRCWIAHRPCGDLVGSALQEVSPWRGNLAPDTSHTCSSRSRSSIAAQAPPLRVWNGIFAAGDRRTKTGLKAMSPCRDRKSETPHARNGRKNGFSASELSVAGFGRLGGGHDRRATIKQDQQLAAKCGRNCLFKA